MNCFYCQRSPMAGGTRIGSIQADAVCSRCGRAVCDRHGALDWRESPGRIKCAVCLSPSEASRVEYAEQR